MPRTARPKPTGTLLAANVKNLRGNRARLTLKGSEGDIAVDHDSVTMERVLCDAMHNGGTVHISVKLPLDEVKRLYNQLEVYND